MTRKRKPAPAPPPPPRPGRWRGTRPALVVVLTLAAAAGLLVGLGWVGDEARRRLGPRDRYAVRFADIACDAPPGADRPAFLAEVRYVSGFPESFQALDPDAASRLAAAFAGHPWVGAVDGVTVEPPATVRVRLRFRTPVLAVRTDDGEPARMVDAGGVLLPAAPAPAGLAELDNRVPPPGVASGKPWPDETVKRAAELAKSYAPRRIEKTPAGWRLTQPDGKMLLVGW